MEMGCREYGASGRTLLKKLTLCSVLSVSTGSKTYLLNTHADAARFAREVDHPNCRVMYDTFHANIEEKDIAQAIRDCSDVLVHVHISENDRSTPGEGKYSLG